MAWLPWLVFSQGGPVLVWLALRRVNSFPLSDDGELAWLVFRRNVRLALRARLSRRSGLTLPDISIAGHPCPFGLHTSCGKTTQTSPPG